MGSSSQVAVFTGSCSQEMGRKFEGELWGRTSMGAMKGGGGNDAYCMRSIGALMLLVVGMSWRMAVGRRKLARMNSERAVRVHAPGN